MDFVKFIFEDLYILDSGPYSVICCRRSYFDKDLISWIHSTSKSMKIVVQQILMKPDYMYLFKAVVISASFYSSDLLPEKQIT